MTAARQAPIGPAPRRWLVLALLAALLPAASVIAACEEDVFGPPPPAVTPLPGEPPPPDPDLDPIPRRTDRSLTITGAGATFPFVLYSRWSDEYHRLNPGIRINYQSLGSGAGIRQVIERTVDYGATDGPMNEEQKADAAGHVWHIPMAMGAVVAAYHLPGNPEVRLSQSTIAAIYLGHITSWGDEAILADNPDADLPDLDIAVVYRSDGSGTTFIWTDFLSAVSDEWREEVGVATAVRWPAGIGANGNEGVTALVRQIPGAIGYVELAFAEQLHLPVATLENHDGFWVDPNFEAVAAAAAGLIEAGEFPEHMEVRVVNAPGEDSYPAAGFTWLLLYEELDLVRGMTLERAQELIRYVLWSLDHDGGQQWNVPLDYALLHPHVQQLARKGLKQITFEGRAVWETMQP